MLKIQSNSPTHTWHKSHFTHTRAQTLTMRRMMREALLIRAPSSPSGFPTNVSHKAQALNGGKLHRRGIVALLDVLHDARVASKCVKTHTHTHTHAPHSINAIDAHAIMEYIMSPLFTIVCTQWARMHWHNCASVRQDGLSVDTKLVVSHFEKFNQNSGAEYRLHFARNPNSIPHIPRVRFRSPNFIYLGGRCACRLAIIRSIRVPVLRG